MKTTWDPRQKALKALRRIKSRCNNPRDKDFKYYGARGIRLYKPWYDPETFLAEVGLPPTPNHSIDRFPNCNGHYSPGNVRWATAEEQSNNKHDTVKYPYLGKELTVAQLARELNMSYHTVNKRLKELGWPLEDVIERAKRRWGRKAQTGAKKTRAAG